MTTAPDIDRSETPAAPPVLGINSHLLLDEDLELIRSLGIRDVRTTLGTDYWQAVPSYRDAMREAIERAHDYGCRVLIVAHNAASGAYSRHGYDPYLLEREAAVMLDMMRELPTVDAWQLWNEQDVWHQAPFGAGAGDPAEVVGRRYAQWFRGIYPVAKAESGARIITGATADHASRRWRGFLRGMMAEGVDADGVGIHAYGPWSDVRPHLIEARGIVGELPLWLTESGPDVEGWSEARQLEAWESVLEGLDRAPLVARVYPYCLQTDPEDPWFGLRRVDGTPRPVLRWLRAR